MNGNKPLVSLLCPSYNHEKYIKYFLDSVLSQTLECWELIIVDDCSTDNNVEEIKKYTDSRIVLVEHSFNMGINSALNTAFEKSNGEYLVFIASDDMLEPKHLQITTEYLNNNPNICAFYSSLNYIDENNNIYAPKKPMHKDFNTKYDILRELFFNGNQMASPGLIFRREIFSKLYPLDISLLQYQDYQLNIEILIYGDIHISKERLVNYRLPNIVSGISARSNAVIIREEFETDKLLNTFLQISDLNLIKKIFGTNLINIESIKKETIPFFLGLLALSAEGRSRKRWGYQTLMKYISSENNLQDLFNQYNFDFKQFRELTNNIATKEDIAKAVYNSRFLKFKKLIKLYIIISFPIIICILLFFSIFCINIL